MLWCEYWWLSTFPCGGFGGPPPRKLRNMKCSRSDSRHILVLLRVTLCSEPNIFLYSWLKHYIFHSEVGGSGPPWPPPPPWIRHCICPICTHQFIFDVAICHTGQECPYQCRWESVFKNCCWYWTGCCVVERPIVWKKILYSNIMQDR